MLIANIIFLYYILFSEFLQKVVGINIPILVLTQSDVSNVTFIKDIFAFNSSSLFNYNIIVSSFNSSCIISENELQSDLQTVIVYERNRCMDKFIKKYSRLTFIHPHSYIPKDKGICPTNLLSGVSTFEKSYFSMMNFDGNFVVVEYSNKYESEVFYKTYLHYKPYQFKSLHYKGSFNLDQFESFEQLINTINDFVRDIDIVYLLIDPQDAANFAEAAQTKLSSTKLISINVDSYKQLTKAENFYYLSTKKSVVTSETDSLLKAMLIKWKSVVEDSFSYNSQLILSKMAGSIIGEDMDDDNYDEENEEYDQDYDRYEITNMLTTRCRLYLMKKFNYDKSEVIYTYLANSPELFTISYSPPANLSLLNIKEFNNNNYFFHGNDNDDKYKTFEISEDKVNNNNNGENGGYDDIDNNNNNNNEIDDDYFSLYERDLTICDPFYKEGSTIVIALFVYEEIFISDTSVFNTISYFNEIKTDKDFIELFTYKFTTYESLLTVIKSTYIRTIFIGASDIKWDDFLQQTSQRNQFVYSFLPHLSQICLSDENVLYLYPNFEIQIHAYIEFVHINPDIYGNVIYFFVQYDIETIQSIIIESYLYMFYDIKLQEVGECLDIKNMLDEITQIKEDDEDYSIFVYLSQECTKYFFEYYRELRNDNKFKKIPLVLIPFGIFFKEQFEYYKIDYNETAIIGPFIDSNISHIYNELFPSYNKTVNKNKNDFLGSLAVYYWRTAVLRCNSNLYSIYKQCFPSVKVDEYILTIYHTQVVHRLSINFPFNDYTSTTLFPIIPKWNKTLTKSCEEVYPQPKTMCYIFQLFETEVPKVIVYKFFNSINYGYIPDYENLPNLNAYGYNCEWNDLDCYLESVNDCINVRKGNYLVGAITDEGIQSIYKNIPVTEINKLKIYTTYPLSVQFCYKNLFNIGLTLDQIVTGLIRMINNDDDKLCIVGLDDLFTNNLILMVKQLPIQFSLNNDDNIPIIIVNDNSNEEYYQNIANEITAKCSDSSVKIFSTIIDPTVEKMIFDSNQLNCTIIHLRTVKPVIRNETNITTDSVQNYHLYVFPLYTFLNNLADVIMKAVKYVDPNILTIIPKNILLDIFTQLTLFFDHISYSELETPYYELMPNNYMSTYLIVGYYIVSEIEGEYDNSVLYLTNLLIKGFSSTPVLTSDIAICNINQNPISSSQTFTVGYVYYTLDFKEEASYYGLYSALLEFNSHYNTSLPFISLKILDLSKTEDISSFFTKYKPIAMFGCEDENCLKKAMSYIIRYNIPLFYPHSILGMICSRYIFFGGTVFQQEINELSLQLMTEIKERNIMIIYDINSTYERYGLDYLYRIIEMDNLELLDEIKLIGNESDEELMLYMERILNHNIKQMLVFDICGTSAIHVKFLHLYYKYVLINNETPKTPFYTILSLSKSFVSLYLEKEMLKYLTLYSPYSEDIFNEKNVIFKRYMRLLAGNDNYITHSSSITYSFVNMIFQLLFNKEKESPSLSSSSSSKTNNNNNIIINNKIVIPRNWYFKLVDRTYLSPHGSIRINKDHYITQNIRILVYNEEIERFIIGYNRITPIKPDPFPYYITGKITECDANYYPPNTNNNNNNNNNKDPIIVGFIHPISGEYSQYLYYVHYIFKNTFDKINEEGGILNRMLVMYYGDTTDDMNKMNETVVKLIVKYKIDVLFGGYPSMEGRKIIEKTCEKYDIYFWYFYNVIGTECSSNTIYLGSSFLNNLMFVLYYLKARKINKLYIFNSDVEMKNILNENTISYLTNEYNIQLSVNSLSTSSSFISTITALSKERVDDSAILFYLPLTSDSIEPPEMYYRILSLYNKLIEFPLVFSLDITRLNLTEIDIKNHYIVEAYHPKYNLPTNEIFDLSLIQHVNPSIYTSIAYSSLYYLKNVMIKTDSIDPNITYHSLTEAKMETLEGFTSISISHHMNRHLRIAQVNRISNENNNNVMLEMTIVYESQTIVDAYISDYLNDNSKYGKICNWEKAYYDDENGNNSINNENKDYIYGDDVAVDYYFVVYIIDDERNDNTFQQLLEGHLVKRASDGSEFVNKKMVYPVYIRYNESDSINKIEEYSKHEKTLVFFGCITRKCLNEISPILNEYNQYIITYFDKGNLCNPNIINLSPTPNQYVSNIIPYFMGRDFCYFIFIQSEKEGEYEKIKEFEILIKLIGCFSKIIQLSSDSKEIDNAIQKNDKNLIISFNYYPILLNYKEYENVSVLLIDNHYNQSINLIGSFIYYYSFYFAQKDTDIEIFPNLYEDILNSTATPINYISYLSISTIFDIMENNPLTNPKNIINLYLKEEIKINSLTYKFNEFNNLETEMILLKPIYPITNAPLYEETFIFQKDLTLPSSFSLYQEEYRNIKCNFSSPTTNYQTEIPTKLYGVLYSTTGINEMLDRQIIVGLFISLQNAIKNENNYRSLFEVYNTKSTKMEIINGIKYFSNNKDLVALFGGDRLSNINIINEYLLDLKIPFFTLLPQTQYSPINPYIFYSQSSKQMYDPLFFYMNTHFIDRICLLLSYVDELSYDIYDSIKFNCGNYEVILYNSKLMDPMKDIFEHLKMYETASIFVCFNGLDLIDYIKQAKEEGYFTSNYNHIFWNLNLISYRYLITNRISYYSPVSFSILEDSNDFKNGIKSSSYDQIFWQRLGYDYYVMDSSFLEYAQMSLCVKNIETNYNKNNNNNNETDITMLLWKESVEVTPSVTVSYTTSNIMSHPYALLYTNNEFPFPIVSAVLELEQTPDSINNYGFNETDSLYYTLDYNSPSLWKVNDVFMIGVIVERNYKTSNKIDYNYYHGFCAGVDYLNLNGGIQSHFVKTYFYTVDTFMNMNLTESKVNTFFVMINNEQFSILKEKVKEYNENKSNHRKMYLFYIPKNSKIDSNNCNLETAYTGPSSSQSSLFISDILIQKYIYHISIIYNNQNQYSKSVANEYIKSLSPRYILNYIIEFNSDDVSSIGDLNRYFNRDNNNDDELSAVIVIFGQLSHISGLIIERIFTQINKDKYFVIQDIYLYSIPIDSMHYLDSTYHISTFFPEYEGYGDERVRNSVKAFVTAIKKTYGSDIYVEEPIYLSYLSLNVWSYLAQAYQDSNNNDNNNNNNTDSNSNKVNVNVNENGLFDHLEDVLFLTTTGLFEMRNNHQLSHILFLGKFNSNNNNRYEIVFSSSTGYSTYINSLYDNPSTICDLSYERIKNNLNVTYTVTVYNIIILLEYSKEEHSREIFYDYYNSIILTLRTITYKIDSKEKYRIFTIYFKDITELNVKIDNGLLNQVEYNNYNMTNKYDDVLAVIMISDLNNFQSVKERLSHFELIFYIGMHYEDIPSEENIIPISLSQNQVINMIESFIEYRNIKNILLLINNNTVTVNNMIEKMKSITVKNGVTIHQIILANSCDDLINKLNEFFMIERSLYNQQLGVINHFRYYCYKEIIDFFDSDSIPTSNIKILHTEVSDSLVRKYSLESVGNYFIFHSNEDVIKSRSIGEIFEANSYISLNDYTIIGYTFVNIFVEAVKKAYKYNNNKDNKNKNEMINPRIVRYGLYDVEFTNEISNYKITTSNKLEFESRICEYSSHLTFIPIISRYLKSESEINYGKTYQRERPLLSLSISTYLVIAVGLILNLLFLCLIYVNRKSAVIIQSNLIFSMSLNCVGFINHCVAIFLTLPADSFKYFCIIREVLLIFALDECLYIFFVKTWKIHVVVNNRSLNKTSNKTKKMKIYLLILFLLHMLSIIIWQIIKPSELVKLEEDNNDLLLLSYYPICIHDKYFSIIQTSIIIMFMLCLGYIAFRTREVDEAYSDSNAIIVGLIIIIIALVILIPLSEMLDIKNESVFTAFILSFTTTAVTFLITGYRLFEAHFEKIKNEEKRGLIDLLSINTNKISPSSSNSISNHLNNHNHYLNNNNKQNQSLQQQQDSRGEEKDSFDLVERININNNNNNNDVSINKEFSDRNTFESRTPLECSYLSSRVSGLTREECESSINLNKK